MQSPRGRRQKSANRRIPDFGWSDTTSSAAHARCDDASGWWSNVWKICTQACIALVVAGIVCVIIAWASPVSSWPSLKGFIQPCRIFAQSSKSRGLLPANAATVLKIVGAIEKTSDRHDKQAPSQVIPITAGTEDNLHMKVSQNDKKPWSNELEARAVMERLLRVPFPKVRPPWLLNSTTGRCLELDLYAESLALAVEVDGHQHAEWPNAFHATRDSFEKQQLRDSLKDTLCKLQGVRLIRIPHTVKRKEIGSFLRQQLEQSQISVAGDGQ